MRYLTCVLVALPLTACFPAKQDPSPTTTALPAIKVPEIPRIEPTFPPTPTNPPRVTVREFSGITFEGVAFDSRSHRLIVADQPNGPGSRFADSGSAGRTLGGIAAINAGFFTPEGEPLGLVVASGKTSGSWNTGSSLGSGAWHESTSGILSISRREALGRKGASSMRELIQAGPLLVENGRPVSGLEATKSSVRTLILWDGGTHWWIGRSSPCTLAAMSHALASGWPTRQALNLDGGRSSDLWIANSVTGGPLVRRELWNRPVRNFLVLVPK
jgi:uncharacterized protein YigE (DUF2233 family)